MNLYPAIDLKNGHCIRLKKGQLNKITYYNSNPVEQAKEFNNHKTSDLIDEFISTVRKIHPKILSDRVFHNDINKVSKFLKKNRRVA